MATVRQARAAFFARAGFDEGTYDDAWVRLPLGPLTVRFPNTAGRKRAVRLHDVHHALTGYDASWRGELAISAWEIGSGCGRYVTAWAIDLGGLAAGALVYPTTTLRAFVRGRRSGNLYRALPRGDLDDVLEERVEVVRARLGVDDAAPRAGAADVALFAGAALAGAALWLAPLCALALTVWSALGPR